MANTDKINIDFQLFSLGDPKVLVIVDTSIWSFIVDKTSIIEITPPGTDKVYTYEYEKNKTNIFNSSNLFLSPIGVENDLPDGIYKIKVTGSPSTFFKERDVLKTDKTRLELYRLYASLGFRKQNRNSKVLRIINEVKILLDSAEALTFIGDSYLASKNLQEAAKQLSDYNNCKECNEHVSSIDNY